MTVNGRHRLLLARAEVAPGVVRDVRIEDDRILEVDTRLRPGPDEEVIDVDGRATLPGLHDHHVHLRSAAAALDSVDVSGRRDADDLGRALSEASASLPPRAWVRAVGYHESIAGSLDRAVLDRLAPTDRPVRVQHRSGALWVLNSAALAAAGLTDDPVDAGGDDGVDLAAGHLWRRDDLLRAHSELDSVALARWGRQAAAYGVTGVTDATPDGSVDQARQLAADVRAAGVMQRLCLMGPAGAQPPGAERADLGPVKVLLDDDRLPSLDELVEVVRAAHDDDRRVAVHCVTRAQLVLTLTALDEAGSREGDRIEHGAVIPPELVDRLAALRLTVVTQPHFVAERGDDYRRDVDPDDLDSLYRVGSLLDAGVSVAAGSDAPFGSANPWRSIDAAVRRTTRDGHALGPSETVDRRRALDLWLGHPDDPGRLRTIAPGQPADVCVLHEPWRALADVDPHDPVAHTLVAGQPVHPAP